MRVPVVGARDRFQMLHEARQIREIAPEPVQLGGGPQDGDGALDFDRVARVHGCGAADHVRAMWQGAHLAALGGRDA